MRISPFKFYGNIDSIFVVFLFLCYKKTLPSITKMKGNFSFSNIVRVNKEGNELLYNKVSCLSSFERDKHIS